MKILRSFLRRGYIRDSEEYILALEDQQHVLSTLGTNVWLMWSRKLHDLHLVSQAEALSKGFKSKLLKGEDEPVIIQVINLHIFGMVFTQDKEVYNRLLEKIKDQEVLVRKAAVWALCQSEFDEENTRKVLIEIINNEVRKGR